MKKFLFSLIAVAVLFISINIAKAITCESYEYNDNGVCRPIPSRSLQLIIAGYCKPGQVEYTEWSDCNKHFGKNGLQWRNIIYPTKSGCVPSVYDQVNTQRECLK